MAKKIHIVLVNKPLRRTPLTAQGCGDELPLIDTCLAVDNFPCGISSGAKAVDTCGTTIDAAGCCAYANGAEAYDSCAECDYAGCCTFTEGDGVSDSCTGSYDGCSDPVDLCFNE